MYSSSHHCFNPNTSIVTPCFPQHGKCGVVRYGNVRRRCGQKHSQYQQLPASHTRVDKVCLCGIVPTAHRMFGGRMKVNLKQLVSVIRILQIELVALAKVDLES